MSADRRSEIVSPSPPILAHHEVRIREWLLRLLRFVITNDPSDQIAAFTTADEMDAGCRRWQPSGRTFFTRTTKEICAAVLSSDDPAHLLVLRKHLQRIDEPRLKRAFESRVGFGCAAIPHQDSLRPRLGKAG